MTCFPRRWHDIRGIHQGLDLSFVFKTILQKRRKSPLFQESTFQNQVFNPSWEKLTSQTDSNLIPYYESILAHFDIYGQGVHGEIFHNAETAFQNPHDFKTILVLIDNIDEKENQSEELAEFYQELYRKTIAETRGKTGQPLTPSAIVEAMTALMKPQLGERCLDPACGTLGFINSANKYIKKKKTRLRSSRRRLDS